MKRFFIIIFFISSIFSIHAQSSRLYNYRGDQALSEGDYQSARSWFSEGLDSCDTYSIKQLIKIWINHPPMRNSMQFPLRKSFNCLKKLAETGNTEAMALLRDLYSEGIGIEKDSTLANYWHREYGISQGFKVDTDQNAIDGSSQSKAPRKSLLSNHFCSFLTYTYSPTMPFGFTAGIYFEEMGGYISGRTDFKQVRAAFECNNTKVPAIDIENPLYEFNNESWHSQMITGGVLFPVVKNRLCVSAGVGFCKREYYREIRSIANVNFSTGNKSEWCYNTEASYKGLTLEAGGMFIWKRLRMVGGVNSTRFKDLDVYFGLGLTF